MATTSGVGFTRSLGSNGIPIWQGLSKDIQLIQGGFALGATGLAAGSIIPGGTPLICNEATRIATIQGGGSLQASATNSATTYRLVKGSTLKVGDYLAATAGGAAYAITAIDTTNADYDAVTVGTTLGVAFSAGQTLFASTATGASAAAYAAVNALSYDEVVVPVSGQQISISGVNRGTVYARRIPYTYSAGLAALAAFDDIIFSQSK